MNKIKKYTLLLAAICCCACSSEKDLAKSFVEKFSTRSYTPTEKIYVCLPQTVVHTNQTLNQIEDFANLDYDTQDSVIIANTALLDKINDEIFLQQFNDNLVYNISRLGIPMEIVSDPALMPKAVPNKIFTINILQIEAEEYVQRTRSDYEDKNNYYYYDYDLRGFSTNVWYLLNDTATSEENIVVYFKNFETMDEFNGSIKKIENGKALGVGRFDRINVNDTYRSAYRAGAISAKKFCEKIINEYVKDNIKGKKPLYYYYYNPVDNTIEHYDYQSYKDNESFMPVK